MPNYEFRMNVCLRQIINYSFICHLKLVICHYERSSSWPHRLTVRTVPSQGTNRGSIPLGANLDFCFVYTDADNAAVEFFTGLPVHRRLGAFQLVG